MLHRCAFSPEGDTDADNGSHTGAAQLYVIFLFLDLLQCFFPMAHEFQRNELADFLKGISPAEAFNILKCKEDDRILALMPGVGNATLLDFLICKID